jgi:tight adherence protein B
MVGALAPVAIFVGVSATVILTFFSFWGSVNRRATEKARGMEDLLDRGGVTMKPQEIVLTVLAADALLWIWIALALKPPLLVAAILVPVLSLAGAGVFYAWVHHRIAKRLEAFTSQLEMALRLIASGTRVGLALRQALTMVTEELPDPTRHEFLRVIGQTNIGVSVLDALDDLATRMPSNEMLMMARVVRIQSESGGDLAKVLDQLAATIRDRRQVRRKISALTAEGRMSALVLVVIPVALFAFIMVTQPQMAHAVLYTGLGHAVIFTVFALEALGFFWLSRILRVNV